MAQRRRKIGAPANTGRSCAVCGCHMTPQWRKVTWKGKERDACNKCGISLRDFILRTARDFNREPTNNELAAWGQGRVDSAPVSSCVAESSCASTAMYDTEAVEAAEILMEIARSSRSAYSPSGTHHPDLASTSSSLSTRGPTPFSSSAPTATMSLEAVPSQPPKTRGGLFVEVDPTSEYDAYSDLGLTVSSSSPTWSTFEVSTPTSLSSFPDEILVVHAPKNLVKGSPAYELR